MTAATPHVFFVPMRGASMRLKKKPTGNRWNKTLMPKRLPVGAASPDMSDIESPMPSKMVCAHMPAITAIIMAVCANDRLGSLFFSCDPSQCAPCSCRCVRRCMSAGMPNPTAIAAIPDSPESSRVCGMMWNRTSPTMETTTKASKNDSHDGLFWICAQSATPAKSAKILKMSWIIIV